MIRAMFSEGDVARRLLVEPKRTGPSPTDDKTTRVRASEIKVGQWQKGLNLNA